MNSEVAEEWRPVPITEFSLLYEVSNLGRVRSLDRIGQKMPGKGIRVEWSRDFKGRVMRAKPNSRGYPCVYLRNSPIFKNAAVHRLVAQAFIPNPNDLPEVNHIDTVKTNNAVTNLEWIDRVGNHTHAVSAGIMPFVNRKLTDADVDEIRNKAAIGAAYKEMAKEFGVAPSTISRIVSGVRRKHRLTPHQSAA